MRILVMGAGAVGSVVGGLLAKAGSQVALIGRSSHMEEVRTRGLSIEGVWGDHLVLNLHTATSVKEIASAASAFDLVLLCVKSYDTVNAIQELQPCVGPETLVASLQNGLGNVEAIVERLGAERALGGRVIFGADLVEPGRVRVTVFGGDVMLGSPGNIVPIERIQELAAVFAAAGVPTQATDNILAYIWGKALYNGCLNPLSALLDVPYGELLETEASRKMMSLLIDEMFAVARAEDAPLPWTESDEYRRVLFQELIPPTAAHYSSMRSDLRRGRPTEIDALNGAIVQMGRRHGIPTPINLALTLLIAAAEGRGSEHQSITAQSG